MRINIRRSWNLIGMLVAISGIGANGASASATNTDDNGVANLRHSVSDAYASA